MSRVVIAIVAIVAVIGAGAGSGAAPTHRDDIGRDQAFRSTRC